jgi:hypothetical protein
MVFLGTGGDPMKRWASVVVAGLAGLALAGNAMKASGEVVSGGVKSAGLEAAVTYHLTVNKGLGTGDYAIGQQVNISADVPSLAEFLEWTGDTQYIADKTKAMTTLIMPCKDVTVTATSKSVAQTQCCSSSSPVLPLMALGLFCLTRSRRRR